MEWNEVFLEKGCFQRRDHTWTNRCFSTQSKKNKIKSMCGL